MKTFTSALAMAGLAACMALPAFADTVCLQTIRIDHTSVKDSRTILFHMKDGKVWQNSLKNACPSLNFHGFIMNIRGGADDVCSNQQSIKVIDSGEVCMMGDFTPYSPAPKT
jgi:hypothetical protein